MHQIRLEKRVVKFIQSIPPKHQNQIKQSILALENNPTPHDSQSLKGYHYRRVDCGEYRVIYRLNSDESTLDVILVGKRDGGKVYQQIKNLH